jgi:hypothetical protein
LFPKSEELDVFPKSEVFAEDLPSTSEGLEDDIFGPNSDVDSLGLYENKPPVIFSSFSVGVI